MARLVTPSTIYRDSYLEAIAEFQQEGRYLQLDLDSLARDLQAYVDDLLSRTERNPDRPELVPETILWLVDDDEYIGRASIRHELSASLLRSGGNIGYDIRPSRRMRGYGKLILKLALGATRELGLTRVLLTCRPTNIGSCKIIEANGGVLENEIDVVGKNETVRMRRYWIQIRGDERTQPTAARRILVLDAMGVLYQACDDEAELLVPFIRANGGSTDTRLIKDTYRLASVGAITASDLWLAVGVNPELEDEYLEGHRLTDGLLEFLPEAKSVFERVVCLSNDVSEWSFRLRRRFGLEDYISGWFISGDIGLRKPDPEIFRGMVSALGTAPSDLIFVDDRTKNLEAASSLGVSCVLFDIRGQESGGPFPVARNWRQVAEMFGRWWGEL